MRLERSFKKFYSRYQDLIETYQRSVSKVVIQFQDNFDSTHSRNLAFYMDLSLGFVWAMYEADDAYSIQSTWSCYWLDQFLTLAFNTLILSKFITFHWICPAFISLI